MIIIYQGSKVSHTFGAEYKGLTPNIATDWSSFSVFMINSRGEIALKWNWQADGGVLSNYSEAGIGAEVNDIVIPFDAAETLALPIGSYSIKLKFTSVATDIDEFSEYKNMFQVVKSPVYNINTE
jgi:hypothetical protein